MTNLGDALQGAFTAHENAERGRARDPHRTVRSIRRRRVAYAAGTGSAAAVAVGAIVLGGTQLPRFAGLTPTAPDPSVSCVAGLYEPGNPGAFGSLEYLGRSYVDTASGEYVFVHPDGTVEQLNRAADGSYSVTLAGEDVLVWAEGTRDTLGTASSDWYRDGKDVQGTGYPGPWNSWAWTVVAPGDVPEGVNTDALSRLLLWSFGAATTALAPGDVPDGASVAVIVNGGGQPVRYEVGIDQAGPDPSYLGDGVTSLDLVVTLADGETYTMTANYDATAKPPVACGDVEPTTAPSVTAIPSPSLEPARFENAEAAGFVCGAALDPELEGTLGLTVTWGEGETFDGVIVTPLNPVNLGTGGILASGTLQREAGGSEFDPSESTGGVGEGDDGFAVFISALAVRDGVVIGVTGDAPNGLSPGGVYSGNTPPGETGEGIAFYASNVPQRLEACPGVDASELGGAQTVATLGYGPLGGAYEFAWTPVERT